MRSRSEAVLVDIPILNSNPETTFLCPGEARPVSRAIHEARLSAAWSGCELCPSRIDPAVARRKSPGTARQTDFIRRTRWGVRGTWQNALSRLQAEHLTAIVTCHLARVFEQEQASREFTDDDDGSLASLEDRPLTLVAGYDGRSSSPDIFAGVVAAALHNGWNVQDVGRSTAASIQETLRSHSGASVSLLVTGSGESAAMTGVDVFDCQGNSVSVPWQSFGVRIRQASLTIDEPGREPSTLSRPAEHLRALQEAESGTDSSFARQASSTIVLELPDMYALSSSRFRSSRTSGELESRHHEQRYRRWLSRWFPSHSENRITCVCFDDLVADRLRWLNDHHGIRIDVIRGIDTQSMAEQLNNRIQETHSDWGIAISDDDRYITVANRMRRTVALKDVSDWINSSTRKTQLHLTSHVPDDDERIVMLDAGRTAGHEVISDGLATLGLIGRITESGTALP